MTQRRGMVCGSSRAMPRICSSGLSALIHRSPGERQQSNMARLLDRCRDRTLMSGAGAGLAAGADRAIFGHILPKYICLFVVNHQRFISAELTKFGLGKEATFPTFTA